MTHHLEFLADAREDLAGLTQADWDAAMDLATRWERGGKPALSRNSSAPGVMELYEAPIRMRGVVVSRGDGVTFVVARVLTESE